MGGRKTRNSEGTYTATKKQIKKDRRSRLLQMVSKDLDIRDKWMGLGILRRGYTPIPYTLKDDKGNRFKVGNKANEAAKFLAKKYRETQRNTKTKLIHYQKKKLSKQTLKSIQEKSPWTN